MTAEAGGKKEKEEGKTSLSPSPLSSSSPPARPRSSAPPPPLLRICVCEGRPLCEGAKLAEELAEEASRAAVAAAALESTPVVEVELCTDAAGPALVRAEAAAGRRSGDGGFSATAAVVLGADAVYPEASSSSSVLSGVVYKVGSRALVEAAAGDAAVPAFALAGRLKVAGGYGAGGGVAALAAAGSGCLPPRSLEENSGDELLVEGRVSKAKRGAAVVVLRNPCFECVPLRLFEASGGGVVVEAAEEAGSNAASTSSSSSSPPPSSSSVTLLTARDVAELAERADERARAAFRMDWL